MLFTVVVHPAAAGQSAVDHHDRGAASVRVRVHDPAPLGDDGRRRRLLRVEDSPPRDRRVFSAIVFGLKAGLGFGGAIGGYLLDAYGYVPNAVQSERALHGIRLTASIYPAIGFAPVRRLPGFYRIDKPTRARDRRTTSRATRGIHAHPSSVGTMTHTTQHSPRCAAVLARRLADAGSATPRRRRTASSSGLKGAFRDAFMVGAALGARSSSPSATRRALALITPRVQLDHAGERAQVGARASAAGSVRLRSDRTRTSRSASGTGCSSSGTRSCGTARRRAGCSRTRRASRSRATTLLARMKDHIQTVVGRYKGRIKGWDVVNEALNEDGTLRQSPWHRIIGHDYIAKAFQFAHEADPRGGALLQRLQPRLPGEARRRRRASCSSLQAARRSRRRRRARRGTTSSTGRPSRRSTPASRMLARAGREGAHHGARRRRAAARRRETRPPTSRCAPAPRRASTRTRRGCPTPCSRRSREALRGPVRASTSTHRDVVDRVTFWGVADGDSWLNGWPVPRAHELSAAVRPAEQAEARLSACDGARAGPGAPADAVIPRARADA